MAPTTDTVPVPAAGEDAATASAHLLSRLRELKRKDDENEGESSAARTQWLESVDAAGLPQVRREVAA